MLACGWVASLLVGLVSAAPQAESSDTRFDRVHLRNGNFLDGRIVKSSPAEIILKLQVGEMTVRRDQIERIEKVAMKSLAETKKAPPPPPPPTPPVPTPPAPDKPREKDDPRPLPAGSDLQRKVVDIFTELHRADFESKPRVLDKFSTLGEEGARFLAEQLPILDAASMPYAATALGKMRDPATLPILTGHLRHPKASVRGLAASALAPFGASAPTADLLPLLSDPDPFVRGSAAMAFRQLATREALIPTARAAADPVPDVRSKAVEAAFEIARRHELQADLTTTLVALLDRAPVPARAELLGALGRTGDKAVWSAAVPHLRDTSPQVRGAAAACLAALGAAEAGDAILSAIQSERERAPRLGLAAAAEKLRVAAAAGPMIPWLRDGDDEVKKAVQAALRTLTAQDFGGDAEAWQKHWDSTRPK